MLHGRLCLWQLDCSVQASRGFLYEPCGQGALERDSCACVQQGVLDAFFPRRSEVTPDYWQYTAWRCSHRLCSAVLHNFSTQVLP